MVKRLCAISLVILAALPFTAPFASFTLSDLRSASAPHATAFCPELTTTDGYVEANALASNVCVQRDSRLLLLRLVTVESPNGLIVAPCFPSLLYWTAPTESPHNVRSLTTALRI